MSKKIELTKGFFALVDDKDFREVNQFRWYAVDLPRKRVKYAARCCPIGMKGKRKVWGQIKLHNFLMPAKKGFIVDHVNNDGLDNRRKNLRYASVSSNSCNRWWINFC